MQKQTLQPALKNALVVVTTTAALYWVLLTPIVAMGTVYNWLLFVPNRTAPTTTAIDNLPIENVTIPSAGGAKLHGWYVHNPSATKTVLFSHGNGGNMDSFVPTLDATVRAGASVLAYDYEGYGMSEGKPSLDGVVEDAQAAYDYLVQVRHVAKDNIVLFGQSLGTGVTCQLMETRPAAAIILMSPYTNIMNVGREHIPWLWLYPEFTFPKQILNTQVALSRAHPRTLIIHGELDQTVPFHHARELAASAINPLKTLFVPKAAHNNLLSVAPQECLEAIKEFVH
jgi:pimeloyl-ACP methyl ester carboxylesterase